MPRKNLVPVDMGGQKITGLGTPTAGTDAVTKAYADALGGGAGASRTTFSNAAYNAVPTDRYIAQIGTMTASRTVTLPAANAVAAGTSIRVADESGTVTGTNTIIVARHGTDTIVNGYLTLLVSLVVGFQFTDLISDGVDSWTAFDAYTAAAAYADAGDVGGGGGGSVSLDHGAGISFSTAGGVTTISADNVVLSARRTTDRVIANNTTTLAGDDVLRLNMTGFTLYRLDAMIGYNAAVVADLKVGWGLPTLSTMAWDASDPIARQWNTALSACPILGTGTNVATRITGQVYAGASGLLIFTAAQVTANPSDVTILAGSFLTLTRLS